MKEKCAFVCGVAWIWFTTTICFFFTVPTEYLRKVAPEGGCQRWNPSFSQPGMMHGNLSNVMNSPCIISFDQHTHTKYGGGGMSPEITILWHLAHGYNAFAVTDHDYTGNGYEAVARCAREKFTGRILVIPGIEWTTDRFHINFLFRPGTSHVARIAKQLPKGDIANKTFVREIINIYRAMGAVATFNHPRYTSTFLHGWSKMDALNIGVDAMEVNDYRGWDNEARRFCEKYGITAITGTDVHQVWTHHPIYTILGISTFSDHVLFEAIREGKTVTAKTCGSYV